MTKTRMIILLLVAGLLACSAERPFDLENVIQKRPSADALIFDYVGLMEDIAESTRRYLKTIRNRYHIEIVIAAFPTLKGKYTIDHAAADMFTKWDIGRQYKGRGILLLLVEDTKEVKLEVGMDLEDVFTDLFAGYIERLQLPPRFAAGELEIGLVAVMEELEARSQVKFQGGYTPEDIGEMDAEYLSQGGGARLKLDDGRKQIRFSGAVNHDYPAGQTPEEAWQTMVRRWHDKVRDPYLGVFTPLTRITYRDYTDMPDSRFEKEYRTYAQKPYEILRQGDYAVVWFGRKEGWDNAPFLLCRTLDGWQFDMVHQRRFIRMGPAPKWGVEFSEHPHMGLLMDAFHFRGQDIPVEREDLYTIERDAELANQILEQESRYQADPNDFDTVMTLGRLYTLVSLSRKGMDLLNKARAMNPDDPRPYKYLAIAHVNAHYQYDSALKLLDEFLKRAPDGAFGHNFKGYICYRRKEYKAAADAFEQALALKPDNCYAHFYLAYTYAWLYDQTVKIDPRRNGYKDKFRHHAARTRSYEASHPLRVETLNRWLGKEK
ncbi:MAG: TPM domain-containing protein [Desulfobacterales bacterium]|nr:TPM domain-containing protein [Desulfobacterales bacterium]